MTTFAEAITTNPPRLVVLFQEGVDGREQFQWGVVGNIPILTLIGAISRIQGELAFRAAEPCDKTAFVLAWDAEDKTTSWFVHPSIPTDPLVGMLETIKEALVVSRLGQCAAAQRVQVLGPDGNPMRG